jgi:plasmid stability protein
MADVKIRMLPDWVVQAHRSRAEAVGRSLEEELRTLLTEAALAVQGEFSNEADTFREGLQAKYGTFADSTPELIRDREQRG